MGIVGFSTTEKRWGRNPAVIPARLTDDLLDPRVKAERSDAFGVFGDDVPDCAAGVDDGVAVLEEAQGEKPVAQVKPDPLHRVELG